MQQGSLLEIEPIKGDIKVGDKITGKAAGPLEGGKIASVIRKKSAKWEAAEKDRQAAQASRMNPSKAVAIARRQQQVALKSSGDPMVDMYERALRDPAVDPAKLKALLDIRAEEAAREAHRHFNIALHDAQAEIPRIFANKSNKSTSSRYADYPSLDDAVRPIYVKHGFGLTFNTGKSALPDHVLVYCDAVNAGHEKRYEIDMPADGKGAKGGDVMTKTHAAGSAVSYGMRYLLIMIFNIPIIKDDDGNRAGKVQDTKHVTDTGHGGFPGDRITTGVGVKPISSAQRDIIVEMITDAKISEKNFCVKYGINQIIQLPAELFEAAKKAIADHKSKAAK